MNDKDARSLIDGCVGLRIKSRAIYSYVYLRTE